MVSFRISRPCYFYGQAIGGDSIGFVISIIDFYDRRLVETSSLAIATFGVMAIQFNACIYVSAFVRKCVPLP